MSNFYCDKCGALVSDSPAGYLTGCEHYPSQIKVEEISIEEALLMLQDQAQKLDMGYK